jgi:hypothetical protein
MSQFPTRPQRVYRGSTLPLNFVEFFSPELQYRCPAFLSVTRNLHVAMHFLNASRVTIEEVDGLDCRGRWWQAFVLKRTAHYFVLHFMGWDACWNENIPISKSRTHLRARNSRSPVGPRGLETLEDVTLQMKGSQEPGQALANSASQLVLWMIDFSNLHHQRSMCSMEEMTEMKEQQHYFMLPYTSFRVISSTEVQPSSSALIYRQIHVVTTEGSDDDLMVAPWY